MADKPSKIKIGIIPNFRNGATMRKYSRQRELILEILKNSYSHPTADEVFDLARSHDPNISLGTVYRNLELLCADGTIEKIPTGLGKDRYDLKKSPHHHALCERCGEVVDFEFKLDMSVFKNTPNLEDFEVTKDEIRIIGICKKCKNLGENYGTKE